VTKGGQLNRSAFGGLGLKGLPIKPDVLKKTVMEDSIETKYQASKLDDMPEVDMTMRDTETIGNLEADDDDEDMEELQEGMAIEEDEVDPLDAFMTGVKEAVKKVNQDDLKKLNSNTNGRARLDDPTNDDADEVPGAPVEDELDATNLNAEEIMALAVKKVKKKELATIDHTKLSYEPFRKEFYVPPPDVAQMTDEEADLLRLELDGIKIRGVDCPRPVAKWSHFGLPASWCVNFSHLYFHHAQSTIPYSLDVIKKHGWTAPTPIQAQAIPAIMAGRDVIGVAKTGSGKTIAFLLPLFRHIKDQRPLEQMEGPMAVVMTPTRELATQIHRECKPFLKVLNLRVQSRPSSPIYANSRSFDRLSVRMEAPLSRIRSPR
jgi:ATP-dependent RNA helicase DDX46/PRP5